MCILQQIQVYQSATIVLLVLSILVIIITFFGCCGAYKENRCLLATVCTYMTIRSFAKVVFMIIHQKLRFIFFFTVLWIWRFVIDWRRNWRLFRFHGKFGCFENAICWSIERVWWSVSKGSRQDFGDSLGFVSNWRKNFFSNIWQMYVKNLNGYFSVPMLRRW